MSELQAGMLALVVGCRTNPSNIGKVVELIRVMNIGDVADGRRFAGPAPAWKIKGDSLVYLKVSGEAVDSDTSYAESRHLMPITPMQDPLAVTHKEELHA